jgi:hypothetical protein
VVLLVAEEHQRRNRDRAKHALVYRQCRLRRTNLTGRNPHSVTQVSPRPWRALECPQFVVGDACRRCELADGRIELTPVHHLLQCIEPTHVNVLSTQRRLIQDELVDLAARPRGCEETQDGAE